MEELQMKKIVFRICAIISVIALATVCLTGCAVISDTVNVAADTAAELAPGNKNIQQASKIAKSGATLLDNEIGPMQRFQLGYEVSANFLGEYKPLPQNHPTSLYLAKVGTTVALGSTAPYQFRHYTFLLVEDDELNAFAAPGGIILVTQGMMEFLQNEDELAAILGHEVAHVELDHGIRSVGRENIIRFFNLIADAAIQQSGGSDKSKKMIIALSKKIMDVLMNKIRQGYSVDVESEADRRSVEICHALGYDPYALPRLLERFKQATGSYGGANYPKERLADIKAHIAEMGPIKQPDTDPIHRQRYRVAINSSGQ